jgi:peptide chain release factor subunit 1
MATVLTTDILRDLAGFRADNGCAITIYLDLDPSSSPTATDLDTKFKSVLSEAERAGERRPGDRECRLAVRDDLDRIRDWWDDEFDRDGLRGVAVFASSADGLFRTLPLTRGAGDSAQVGPTLHLSPLAATLAGEGVLVAVVSRERGTVYRLEGGRLREVADETEEQPGQHDQGGWSQGRYARHIDHLVQQHLKTVGAELDRQVRRGGLRLVLVGPEELRGEFDRALSSEAREAVIGWTTAEAHAGPRDLLAAAQPLLDGAQKEADAEALARYREERGRGARAAAGWKQVLDAASDLRIELLLVEPGAAAKAWECPRCGRASADGGSCPLDGTKLEVREDAVDLALRGTLAGGGSIVRVEAGALDGKGIGALLRF